MVCIDYKDGRQGLVDKYFYTAINYAYAPSTVAEREARTITYRNPSTDFVGGTRDKYFYTAINYAYAPSTVAEREARTITYRNPSTDFVGGTRFVALITESDFLN